MENRIVIKDPELAQHLQRIARQEHRSVRAVLASMVAQYQPQKQRDNLPDADALARQVRLAAYQEAREYWHESGDSARAALTDEQLDEQFWLFDQEGIPRLKTEQNKVQIPDNSLYHAGKALEMAGFRSGQSDIGARSREILETEFTDYLIERMKRPTDHDKSPAD